MKRYVKQLFAVIIGLMITVNVSAQCINNFAFGSATFGPCSTEITATTCAFVSEYSTFNGLITGQEYRFTHISTSPDNYITITDLANNILVHGPSPVVWTSTVTGSVRFHYSNDASCTAAPGGCREARAVCISCPAPAQATCDLALSIGVSIPLTGGSETVFGNTVCTGPAQAVPICGTTLNTSAGQWYKYESGDFVGWAEVTTCVPFGTSTFDTKIGVFTGECNSATDFSGFTCVAGNDDSSCPGGSGLLSRVAFEVEDNTTYWIYVTGFGGATGPFELTLTLDTEGPYVPPVPINNWAVIIGFMLVSGFVALRFRNRYA